MSKRWVIETLATGDEIVNGDVVDSNSAYLSRRLVQLGYLMTRHNALPDDERLLSEGILEIAERADVCVSSGGLGPTEDDLTADIVAKLAGTQVVFDPEAVKRLKERLRKFNLHLAENHIRTTRVPATAEVFQPEVGTAPAFSLRIKRCLFFFLPGVPEEYRHFVERDVLPMIAARFPGAGGVVTQLKTLNIPEAHVAEKFEDYRTLFPKVKVGYRAHAPEVWVKFTAEAGSRAEALRILSPAVEEAERRLGDQVFGRDEEELPDLVHELFLRKGLTLALAESCTGGAASQLLPALPGSSGYFLGSAVTESSAAKQTILGVSTETLEKEGAVSEACATEMAIGALNAYGSDVAVSITGIAGPGGGSERKPVGLVHFCLAWKKEGEKAPAHLPLRMRFPGNRERIQKAAAYTALDMLRRHLRDRDQ